MAFQSCLNEFNSAANRFKDLIEFACQQLCTSAIKPRIKTLMDTYTTINHKISEVMQEENSLIDNVHFRMNSLNSKPMIHSYRILSFKSMLYLLHLKYEISYRLNEGKLIGLFQNALSPANCDRLISASTNEIVTMWEKVLLKCGFNRVSVISCLFI